jgi:hypothetical protein
VREGREERDGRLIDSKLSFNNCFDFLIPFSLEDQEATRPELSNRASKEARRIRKKKRKKENLRVFVLSEPCARPLSLSLSLSVKRNRDRSEENKSCTCSVFTCEKKRGESIPLFVKDSKKKDADCRNDVSYQTEELIVLEARQRKGRERRGRRENRIEL